MSISRIMGGALAASLAFAAQAQVVWPPSKADPAKQPQPTEQPQAAPAPAPQGPAHQLTAEQRAAFGTLRQHNAVAIRVGDVAASRAASEEVKSLARMIANDHRRVEGEIANLTKERGVDWNTLTAPPSDQRFEEEIGQLSTRSGEEFDKEFVAFLTRNGTRFVDALKRARDITPGKDAQLKKSLDDMENLEEAHLTASRQLKVQRQARTPPAR